MSKATTLAVAAGLLMASSAMAAVVSTDTIQSFSTEHSNYDLHAHNIVDDSFINGPNTGSAATGHADGAKYTMWVTTPNDPDPNVIINLGGSYTVGGMQVWNYNEVWWAGTLNRSVKDITILSSTDGSNFTPQGSFTLAQGPGVTGYAGQSFTFSAPFTASYVKLDINSNYGDDEYGLSEIQFSTAAVPEPAALGMIALSGLVMLHRKRA